MFCTYCKSTKNEHQTLLLQQVWETGGRVYIIYNIYFEREKRKFGKLCVFINDVMFWLKCYNTVRHRYKNKSLVVIIVQCNENWKKVLIFFVTLQRNNQATRSHVVFLNFPFVNAWKILGFWRFSDLEILDKKLLYSLCIRLELTSMWFSFISVVYLFWSFVSFIYLFYLHVFWKIVLFFFLFSFTKMYL